MNSPAHAIGNGSLAGIINGTATFYDYGFIGVHGSTYYLTFHLDSLQDAVVPITGLEYLSKLNDQLKHASF